MKKRLLNGDKNLFLRLYGWAATNPGVRKAAVTITKLSSRIFQALYLGFILFLLVTLDLRIVPFLLGPAAGLVITRGMRRSWHRKRPFVALGVRSLVSHEADNSFPSMHAMSAFVIGMAAWYIHGGIGVIVLFLAGVTGMSRVLVGVHYPSDILVGAGIGVLISTVVFSFL